MDITVNTKLHPLLGKPLRQSLSSRLCNRMYERMGVDWYRFPVEIEREGVGPVLQAFRYMNVGCIGVTKPYKVDVIPFLDGMDELTSKIGAVNTIRVENGKFIGKNVDGPAFLNSLREDAGSDAPGTTFFCFGAGGAGKAICCTLAYHGAKKIYITDKFDKFAKALTDEINTEFSPVAVQIPYEDKAAVERAFRESRVVMNVSGVGMAPDLTATPADPSWFSPDQIAFDATYNPAKTQFLADAEAAGCFIFNGKKMLIRCQMAGFKERLGECPDYEEWSKLFDELLSENSVAGR